VSADEIHPLVATTALSVAARSGVTTVILVEGVSDQVALETLARRRGRDLEAEKVMVVPMGGATTVRHFLSLFGPTGLDLRLSGLCDAGEESDFRRGLEQAGLGVALDRAGMEDLGFFVCVADLEEELIRALGEAMVIELIQSEGDLDSFRIFQSQPAQRGRAVEPQLRRFMGTRSGRKIHYAQVLVDALDLTRVPRALEGALAHTA